LLPNQAINTHLHRWGLHLQNSICNHLPHHRALFEPMTRSATHNPNVLSFRMSVQDEIVVWGVFILTNSAFQQRRVETVSSAIPDVMNVGWKVEIHA
jgi:hypothetical protein